MDDRVKTLCSVGDEITGAAGLVVGGAFASAGRVPAGRVARWTGSEWEPLGAGFVYDVRAIEVFDDGAGPDLYVGGAGTGNQKVGFKRWT